MQLREKQRAKRYYGVQEKQFKSYFVKADRSEGVTGENLLSLLERRLDNVVHRLGFAASRSAARQLVAHGNIFVDGKKLDIPSFLVKPGMVISVTERHVANVEIVQNVERARMRAIPAWLELSVDKPEGKMVSLPSRAEIDTQVTEQLIVEFYSK